MKVVNINLPTSSDLYDTVSKDYLRDSYGVKKGVKDSVYFAMKPESVVVLTVLPQGQTIGSVR